MPHYHIPNYHEYDFYEKYDSVRIFGSCTNITDNLRTKIILMPIESARIRASICAFDRHQNRFRSKIVARVRTEFTIFAE